MTKRQKLIAGAIGGSLTLLYFTGLLWSVIHFCATVFAILSLIATCYFAVRHYQANKIRNANHQDPSDTLPPLIATTTATLLTLIVLGLMPSKSSQNDRVVGPSDPKPSVLTAVRLPPPTKPTVHDEKKDISILIAPDSKIDEQLYLLRRLEFLHSRLPTELGNREQVSTDLSSVRHEFVRGKEYAKDKGMEERLVSMYSDSIELADQYGDFLVDLGAIDREFYRNSVTKTANAGVDSFTGGFELGGSMAVLGVEPITAGVLVSGYIIKKAVDTYQEQQHNDEQKVTEVNRRTNRYLIERSRLLAGIEVKSGLLAEKLKWSDSEVGFNHDETEAQKILDAIDQGNMTFLIERAEQLKKARPRDPFVHAGSGELLASVASGLVGADEDKLAVELRDAAVQDYLHAVQLIPPGRFHDRLRVEYILNAAQNASLMLYHEPKNDELAIQLADAALNIQPLDVKGQIHHIKAFALARNGKFDDSLANFEKCAATRGHSAATNYDWACLLSLANKPVESLTQLKKAWAKGNRPVRFMRRDRDLVNLRASQADAFSEIVTPTWTWRVDYGYLWNDVVFTNTSDFPLTSVAIKMSWKGTDGAKYVEVYWADSIGVDIKHPFQEALSQASKSLADEKACNATVLCEETRSVNPVSALSAVGKYEGIATLMRNKGTIVETTDNVKLIVTAPGNGAVRVQVLGSSLTIDLTAKDLRDGFVSYDSEYGETQRVRVFFHEKTAYGWFQTANDVVNGDIRAFWVEK